MSDTLPCMNCKGAVDPTKAKFFAEVFICETCFTMAEHFHDKLLREFQFLLTMAKESIRLALVQGKFSFPEGPAGEATKREVLEEILKLEEARAAQAKDKTWPSIQTTPTTPSTDDTPPHVRTLARLGAKDSGSSSKGSPPT